MIRADYDTIRPDINHGDVIAFGGEGIASSVIKLVTNSSVSHVGIVYQTDEVNGTWQNWLMESTSLNGMSGVAYTRLSTRLMDYRGRVWWLPLSESFRNTMDWFKAQQWLDNQKGKPYATKAAIFSALDKMEKLPLIGKWFTNPEKYQQLFCSQLVCGAFKAGGAFPENLNPAEITPRDLTVMNIYREYLQLKGTDKDIKYFNCRPVEYFTDR